MDDASTHAYGALLIADGQFKEAESVYLRDLEVLPANGWALLVFATHCGTRSKRKSKSRMKPSVGRGERGRHAPRQLLLRKIYRGLM